MIIISIILCSHLNTINYRYFKPFAVRTLQQAQLFIQSLQLVLFGLTALILWVTIHTTELNNSSQLLLKHLLVLEVDLFLALVIRFGFLEDLAESLLLVLNDLLADVGVGWLLHSCAETQTLQLVNGLDGSSGTKDLNLFDQYSSSGDLFLQLESARIQFLSSHRLQSNFTL